MKVHSLKTTQIIERVEIQVEHRGKVFSVHLSLIDGKYNDEEKRISTSYLTYLNTNSPKARKAHAKLFKKFAEKHSVINIIKK